MADPLSTASEAPESLRGRHALITGAGRGIGAAIAAALAADGARVSLLGRRVEALREVAERLGPDSFFTSADVTDESGLRTAVDRASAALGPVDILVNNAGAADSAPFTRITAEQWQRMLAVNLTGVLLCTQAVLPGMLERGHGRIVNIASTAGLKGYAYVAAYCAAKHGVIGLTRALAIETARKGVTVNAVCPGYTATDMVEQALDTIQAKTGRSRDEALAELVRHNPQGRLVQPEEVAEAVLWLCRPGAASVTGQAIVVAGGEVM